MIHGSPTSAPSKTRDHVDDLDLAPGHCAVVGLQWGDEGKGKIVDLLSRRYDLVVRYNGGANAGHTVVVGDQKFALHLIPSGILYPGKINVLGNGVVIDPEQLVKEMNELRQRGVHIGENIRISSRAHLVLPYHKLQDALMEANLSKAHGDGQKIGTTGRGIGPCYADKALRSTAIRAGELLDPASLREKLKHLVAIKNLILAGLSQGAGQEFVPLDAAKLTDDLLAVGQKLAPHICDTTQLLHEAMAQGKELLFEGANATLLDIDHGTFPFVTSSNCSTLGVPAGTGVPGHRIRHVVGIMKAYQTRVGGGPMPTELKNAIGDRIRERGREYGTTTGRPRRCGWLDLVATSYSARVSGVTGVALMLLDVLSGFETLKVCTAYKYRGQVLKVFPEDAQVLAQAEPVYVEVPGFSEEIDACREFAQLPQRAKQYIQLIEDHLGVPVKTVSVGPRRDQTLIR